MLADIGPRDKKETGAATAKTHLTTIIRKIFETNYSFHVK